MELDEMIRRSAPHPGPPPGLDALRAQSARRTARTRRTRLAVGVVAVAVVLAIVGGQLVGDEPDTTHVSVQPPRDRESDPGPGSDAEWEVLGVVDGAEQAIGMVALGDRLVIASSDPDDDPDLRQTSTVLFDPATGESIDMELAETEPYDLTPGNVMDIVAWGDRVVILTAASGGVDDLGGHRLDEWSEDDGWRNLPLPTDSPVSVAVSDDELFLMDEPYLSGSTGTKVWRTSNGETWTRIADPTLVSTWSPEYVAMPDGLMRWIGDATQSEDLIGDAPAGEVWDRTSDRWTPVDPSPVGSLWFRSGVWTGSAMVGCGAHNPTARYDCLSWTPDDGWQLLPVPPLDQSDDTEGFGYGMQTVWDGERLVVGEARALQPSPANTWWSLRPGEDDWRPLPPLPAEMGSALESEVIDGIVYVLAAALDPDDPDATPVMRIARITAA